MPTPTVILATYDNDREITVSLVQEWIQNQNIIELSNFIYERLYSRYIKPFHYNNSDYKKNYKNGFSIMASACLLIETYVSFKAQALRNTDGNSERCFGYFFVSEPNFNIFSTGALSESRYLDTRIKIRPSEKTGVPHQFYKNVRCGILHNGETKNGWLIAREGLLFDVNNKTINATEFSIELKNVLENYKNQLCVSNFNDPIFQNYVNRLKDLIATT